MSIRSIRSTWIGSGHLDSQKPARDIETLAKYVFQSSVVRDLAHHNVCDLETCSDRARTSVQDMTVGIFQLGQEFHWADDAEPHESPRKSMISVIFSLPFHHLGQVSRNLNDLPTIPGANLDGSSLYIIESSNFS